ncbi:MAG: hypothetical protein ACFFE6_13015 [Candidatus Thorarchaeota archaeon]
MEDMKITSKIRYNRARIRNGYEPHRLLKMIHEQMVEKSSEKESKTEVKR